MEFSEEPRWYCIRTRPKNEKNAAALLRRETEVEAVFAPQIRYQKATRRGKVWFVEAMFPGYILARFALHPTLRLVLATGGITGIVHFGDEYPALEDTLVNQLREEIGDEEVRILEDEIQPGEELLITDGAMKGLEAVVTRIIPGTDRIRILMNLLGETREVEIDRSAIGRTKRKE